MLLIAAVVGLAARGSDGDAADGNRVAAEVSTTAEGAEADSAEVQARYDDAVSASCEQLKSDITPEMLQPPLDYEWSDEFDEVLGIKRTEMVGAIRECAKPAAEEAKAQKEAAAAAAAEQERQAAEAAAEQARRDAEAAAAAEQAAIDNAPAVDVDAVVKNPDAGKGTVYRLVALVTQMDAATGPCNFRGYWDNTVRAYNFEYEGDNALFTAEPDVSTSSTCPIFDGIDQDDTMTLTVRLQGSYSYDTQIGGNTTVPHFQVLRVDKLVKG
jgi:hypothetical protein